MKTRIEELKVYVDGQSEMIIGINKAIENDNFRPSVEQRATIDYICSQGRKALIEIERLEQLMKDLS